MNGHERVATSKGKEVAKGGSAAGSTVSSILLSLSWDGHGEVESMTTSKKEGELRDEIDREIWYSLNFHIFSF